MSEDMSEIFEKMNEMLKNNEIPDSIKNMINGLNTNDMSSKDSAREQPTSGNSFADSNQSNNTSSDSSFDMPNFDIGTMLKMKSIIDNMNKTQNDPRANLLKSLKPYLKPSRKEKVDQYIKLFSMGKAFEALNPLSGDKKNDV